jgi:hypothetical protein
LEGEKYLLQCSFLKLEGLLAAWRAFGILWGFGVQLLASILGSKFWNLCCVQCAHFNMHLLVGNRPLGKGLWFDTSSI